MENRTVLNRSAQSSDVFYLECECKEPLPDVDPSYKPKILKATTRSIDKKDNYEFDLQRECHVLVLYTGGTIGMRTHEGVYSPEPNFLVGKLRQWPLFHDREYASNITKDLEEQPLVLPPLKDGKRVIYTIYEYEPLLDSSNMTMTDWARLAADIKTNYDRFDGFVVLHGTDTMAYTASALSFMLENLGKPVVLTGSQLPENVEWYPNHPLGRINFYLDMRGKKKIPIFETRSDGRDNFIGALTVAGSKCIPEVTIFFQDKLLRGNRSTKWDSEGFDAFKSLNFSPLVEMEISIKVHWDAVFRPQGMQKFTAHLNMCPNVGLLRLFPSITVHTVKAFLQPPMQGVVLQSYGAGNGPDSREDLLMVLSEASKRNVLIINITQCSRGTVAPSYATGKALLDAGVIPGSDMTSEAALSKLSYVLGKDEWDFEKKRKMISTNLRGEMRVVTEAITLTNLTLIEKVAETMRLSSREEVQMLRDAIYPSLMCASAKSGDLHALEKLRSTGAIFSNPDYDARTSLHVAASEGHLDAVKYLLEHGTNVHLRDHYGDTPLNNAVRFNHHDVIKLLRNTGAHLCLAPCRIGVELCIAAAHNELRNLESWFLAGADLNQGDYDKRTPLHVACFHGNKGVVDFLLHRGVNVEVKDNKNQTPLQEAECQGHVSIVEGLQEYILGHSTGLSQGADVAKP